MIGAGTLPPVVALAAWTMVMWAWMYATRIPALNATKLDLDELARDPATSLDDVLPVGVQWKAHNYNHLHEAPTVFYAVAIVLAVIGQGDGFNAQLAWAYVALRVIHSLVQATVNKVMWRFVLFLLSSMVLIGLVVRAVMVMF
ncbi:MAG: MAPEG family protein [Novosphingobium sp.]